ncbi:MAG: flippase-like domain-containing protein [Candidatus Omnitrophica bacterium]|nr:flippase-like domain-containing protein [Candidatus Omnitrophota bacterium]
MKSRFSIFLRIAVSIGLVALLIWGMRDKFPNVIATLTKTNLFMFLLAILLFAFNIAVLLSLRLKLLFDGEMLQIPFGKVSQLSFIGYFFNNFMPTAVGGDIVKAYYVNKHTGQTAKSFISVFMDRFIGLFTFMCIAALAIAVSWSNIDFVLRKFILIFVVCGIGLFIVILNDFIAKIILNFLSKFKLWNIGDRLSKIYRAVHEYKNKKGLIISAMIISTLAQSLYFLTVYILARALNVNILMKTVFLLMPIVSVISMLPSIGGLGLREGAIVAFFGPVIGSGDSLSVSILLLAMLLVISILGAVIYVSASQFRIKRTEISKIEAYQV